MTRWWRWTLALLLCGVGTVVLGPAGSASAAADAGVGRVVADLGTTTQDGYPGFSHDGRYYGYLVPAGDRCELHVYDVEAATDLRLEHGRVVCAGYQVRWATGADVVEWQVNASAGDITVHAWDAGSRQVSTLAPDAHAYTTFGLSADGRYLAFTGRSDSHPAPPVDAPRYASYVFDRTTGVSVPLSRPDLHVDFRSWAPAGSNFVAESGGRTSYDLKTGGCFGSGTSCTVSPSDRYLYFGYQWSADGSAVIGGPGGETLVFDFTHRTLTQFPTRAGYVDFALFLGGDPERLLGYLPPGKGGVVWNRAPGTVSAVKGVSAPDASPTGRYLLYRSDTRGAYRYRDLTTGADAPATFVGSNRIFSRDGYWTKDGSSYVGVGPGGCSSLRQWSPSSNTVSLFGPPGQATCYSVPTPFETDPLPSSASGRFSFASKSGAGAARGNYVVDLRRHVLLGPLEGAGIAFAPSGPDLLAVGQPDGTGADRLLLVDPTPVPDVDDKPRWSAATPANGAQVEVAPGGRLQVQLGASEPQGAPVNLYFRWRDATGTPIASAPKGWSCERKRLAAGATVADCTFAPPSTGWTATRFLDVSATNYATGAQSDTRSYRVGVVR